jgi:hypothetical protein
LIGRPERGRQADLPPSGAPPEGRRRTVVERNFRRVSFPMRIGLQEVRQLGIGSGRADCFLDITPLNAQRAQLFCRFTSSF